MMDDIEFVHLRAGKCTLNGKRVNVRMNDVGKLQVGDWMLADFIKEYGKKKPTEDNPAAVTGGVMPGMLSGGSEEPHPPVPALPKAPARLAALPVKGSAAGSGGPVHSSLPPVNLAALPRQKLAPLPKINRPAT